MAASALLVAAPATAATRLVLDRGTEAVPARYRHWVAVSSVPTPPVAVTLHLRICPGARLHADSRAAPPRLRRDPPRRGVAVAARRRRRSAGRLHGGDRLPGRLALRRPRRLADRALLVPGSLIRLSSWDYAPGARPSQVCGAA